jgi:4-hydroxymandelate oxidase
MPKPVKRPRRVPSNQATRKKPATVPAHELVAVADYERAALSRISPAARAYICSAAGDEISLRWNREAFDRVALLPRVLTGARSVDTRVNLFGDELAHPILLAPAAMHRLAHRDGELATAKGASAAGSAVVLSTLTNFPVEDVVRAATTPVYFQLYVEPDRGVTKALMHRAEAAGVKAFFVTVDTPVTGTRNVEGRARFHRPANWVLPHCPPQSKLGSDLAHASEHLTRMSKYALDWKDIAWIRSQTRLPVILKGLLHPTDAAIAVRENIDGIVVSNHGARNLDTIVATLDALPRVADAIAGRMPILLDGGIRRGTDILKALALGATAVMVCRPYFFGLAVNGADGVASVINILKRELEMAMCLVGGDSIAKLDRSIIWRSNNEVPAKDATNV